MIRCVHHGEKIVARIVVNDAAVADLSATHRQDNAGSVTASGAPRRHKLTIDDLEKFLSRPPRTLAEWADKIREFWSRQ